jgi:Na+-driven multidrug efflux pump
LALSVSLDTLGIGMAYAMSGICIPKRIRLFIALLNGVLTAVALFAVIYIIVFRFTDQLVALFNSEGVETLAVYAHSGMIIYFAGFLFAGFNIVSAGYFSAVECAKESFVVSLLRGIVLMLIMSISLSKLFGMTGVWSSFPATELITAVVCVVFLILKNNRMRKHNNI